jgi:hypothetical protein
LLPLEVNVSFLLILLGVFAGEDLQDSHVDAFFQVPVLGPAVEGPVAILDPFEHQTQVVRVYFV